MRRRRKPTLVPGDASSRAPTYAPGAARASVRAPIYSGRAASASSRRPRHSRAAAAAAAGDRAAGPVARSVDDRNKAVCRVPGLYRAADIRAVGRAGPRRRVASRPYRRQRRSVRSRATTSVDSCRSSYISAEGGLTLACWSWGRVTGLVKPVTACHDGDASVALRGRFPTAGTTERCGKRQRPSDPVFTVRATAFRRPYPLFEIKPSKSYRFSAAATIPFVVSMQPSRR